MTSDILFYTQVQHAPSKVTTQRQHLRSSTYCILIKTHTDNINIHFVCKCVVTCSKQRQKKITNSTLIDDFTVSFKAQSTISMITYM